MILTLVWKKRKKKTRPVSRSLKTIYLRRKLLLRRRKTARHGRIFSAVRLLALLNGQTTGFLTKEDGNSSYENRFVLGQIIIVSQPRAIAMKRGISVFLDDWTKIMKIKFIIKHFLGQEFRNDDIECRCKKIFSE